MQLPGYVHYTSWMRFTKANVCSLMLLLLQAFLEANHLKLIIRSHEGPDARWKREGMQDMSKGHSLDHVTPGMALLNVPVCVQDIAHLFAFKQASCCVCNVMWVPIAKAL